MCPIVSVLTPEKELQDHKPLYAVHVTQSVEVSTYTMNDVGSAPIPNNASLQYIYIWHV